MCQLQQRYLAVLCDEQAHKQVDANLSKPAGTG
jgi:hypothetical protein